MIAAFRGPPASLDPVIGGFSGPLQLSSSVDDFRISPWGLESSREGPSYAGLQALRVVGVGSGGAPLTLTRAPLF